MYVSENGYWRPDSGDKVIIAEEPHVIKWTGHNSEGTSIRAITIPHPYRDGLLVGTELTVESIYSAQDMHYEWIRVKCNSEYLKSLGAEILEIPQRYCKRPE